MKTKIFVCSNSGIDYVTHSKNISAIPIIISFSKEEKYDDFIDMNSESFYNRITYDSSAHLSFEYQNYAKINEYIEIAQKEGYEQFLFILSAQEFCDLFVPVSIAVSDLADVQYKIFDSNSACFPLAYMAIMADEMFNNGKTMDEVVVFLEHVKKNHHIFLFDPSYDYQYGQKITQKIASGKLYEIDDGRILSVKKSKNNQSLLSLFQIYETETEDSDVIPFILYMTKSSAYLPIIEEKLYKITPSAKKIKSYPIPAIIGSKIGLNSIGVGYIVKFIE